MGGEQGATRTPQTSEVGCTASGRRVFSLHLAEDLVYIRPAEPAVAAQGDQAGEEALRRPAADGLGRDMQHPCHLARR